MIPLWRHGIRSTHWLNEQTHGWSGLLAGAAQEALKPNSVITAAAIAYFALFSLFPLTLLSISVASFSLGPLMDQHLVVQRLEFIAPALGQLLGQNIDDISGHIFLFGAYLSVRYYRLKQRRPEAREEVLASNRS